MENILGEDLIVFNNYEALLVDTVTGRIIAKNNLDSGNIDVKVDSKEIRAGKNNGIIATIGASRDITVKLEEPIFNLDTLAMQVGQDVIDEGAKISHKMTKTYTVGAGLTIALDEVPIDGTIAFENPGITATVTAENKSIVISGNGVAVGDEVKILTYQHTTNAKSQSIKIRSDKFASAKKLILENTVYELSGKPIAIIQYIFPQAKPTGNFSIDVKGGDAAKNAMEFKILDKQGELGEVLVIPLDAEARNAVVGDRTIISEKLKVNTRK